MIGLLGEMSSLRQRVRTLRTQLESVISSPDAKSIYWAVLNPQYGLSLHAAPLHVGEILERTLFSQKDSVVLTSATLTTGGSFGYIKNALGVNEADELAIEAPFDYKKSTMIYLPQDIPEPETPGYQQGVAVALTELCRATRGRTLVLFTSHAALRSAHATVHEPLGQEGILVLGQGIDGSPKRVLNHLKANPDTVVFGTSAMWEGVDVVGKALSVLVITRLPFAVPTDPVFCRAGRTLRRSIQRVHGSPGRPSFQTGLRPTDPELERPRGGHSHGPARPEQELRAGLPGLAAQVHREEGRAAADASGSGELVGRLSAPGPQEWVRRGGR